MERTLIQTFVPPGIPFVVELLARPSRVVRDRSSRGIRLARLSNFHFPFLSPTVTRWTDRHSEHLCARACSVAHKAYLKSLDHQTLHSSTLMHNSLR